ncbi:MAG: beta-class carbonic anhydrase [Acidimicrobiales bacterium]
MSSARPSEAVAVVACMDCRLDVETALGLEPGEAHVIRNAGGVLTDDVRRSLLLSQRSLGTRKIVLLHHTDCGLHGVDEERYLDEVELEVGERPDFTLGSFDDAHADVREMARRLVEDPIVPHTDDIVGWVYDVETAELRTVDL